MLFVGPLWSGSTALHRYEAFRGLPDVDATGLDSLETVARPGLVDRVRHRLRRPADRGRVHERLAAAVEAARPDVLFVDSCKVLRPALLERIRAGGATLAFYSPDDMSAAHNSTRRLAAADRLWDLYFTTKSFNVPELRARGVRRPILVGNAFDERVHRPLPADEAGPDFESVDAVFVGTFEAERAASLAALARGGVRVAVYGNGWEGERLPAGVELRPAVYDLAYTRALHAGKVALCFLRRLNRDRVTTRSVEIPAAGRAMVAEKTDEHDELFADGTEYVGFRSDAELVERVRGLLADGEARARIARAGRERCLRSGYSTRCRARFMVERVREAGRS